MKKRIFSMVIAIVMVVGMMPGFTLTVGATTTLTSWDDNTITLNGNDVLDLSGLSESPTSSTTIVVKGNGVKIIGNPDVTFNNVKVRFEYGTSSNKYTSTIDISIQDFKVSGQFVLKQYTAPSSVTINYSGDCSFAGGFGDTNNKAPIIYKAVSGAKLELVGTEYYWHDVTFEGGTVEAVTVDYATNYGIKQCNITVKDCALSFTSLAYINGSNQPSSYPGLSALGDVRIENSQVVAVHPDQVYSGLNMSRIYRLSGIAATGNIDIIDSTVTATGVVTSTSSAGNGMQASPAIKSGGTISISDSTVTAAMRQQTASTCTGGDSAAIGGRTCSSIVINNSTVNAQGYYGAGIGKGGTYDSEWETRVQDYNAVNQTILIEDSTVNAYSYYGAGIGSGWTATKNFTSKSDITIKGVSSVTANSVYGAGIGAGAQGTAVVWDGIEIVVGGVTVGGYGDGGSMEGGEAQTYRSLRKSTTNTVPGIVAASSENTLAVDSGTLTIENSPIIVAESGVKAVSLTVSADAPMLEYTLTKENDENKYVTATPESNLTIARTDSTNATNSYELRPGYSSQAFFPVKEDTYKLLVGDVTLLDVSAETPTFASEYNVSGNMLNSFRVALVEIYSVKINTTIENGTVEANPTKAKVGDTITLTVTPEAGNKLLKLTVGGDDVTDQVSNGKYSFTMPAADVTVTAEFVALVTTVGVTVTQPTKNGAPVTLVGLDANANYTASAIAWTPAVSDKFLGETVYTAEFTLTPNDGYQFDENAVVKVNGTDDGVAVTPNGDKLKVTVTFAETGKREIVEFTGIKTAPTKSAYTYGDTFEPTGLVMTVLYDDGTSGELAYNGNSGLFEFDGTTVLTPVVRTKYTGTHSYVDVDVTVNQKSLTVTAKRQDILYGESITVSVDKVTAEGLVSGDRLDEIALTASTTAVTNDGRITPLASKIVNAGGTDVTEYYNISYVDGVLTIGLVLDYIEITEQPKLEYTEGERLDLTRMAVTAHYTDGSSAELAYTDVEASIPHDTVLTLGENTAVITVAYDGKTAQTDELTVSKEDGTNYYWYFILMKKYAQEFDITASAGEGGSITPDGTAKVKYGKDITYTITPDDGYEISRVTIDGKNVGSVSEYTFEGVMEEHEITVTFEKLPYEDPYFDVNEDDWFYEDVKYVTELGLMNGTGDSRFEPHLTISRAMIVTVLWRMEGEPVVNYAMSFEDVPAETWYTEAVRWAASERIVKGHSETVFAPDDAITREQLSAILHRYAAYKGADDGVITPMLPPYKYSDWAENDIIWALLKKLFEGIGTNLEDMTAPASRAEAAAMLRRFCDELLK